MSNSIHQSSADNIGEISMYHSDKTQAVIDTSAIDTERILAQLTLVKNKAHRRKEIRALSEGILSKIIMVSKQFLAGGIVTEISNIRNHLHRFRLDIDLLIDKCSEKGHIKLIDSQDMSALMTQIQALGKTLEIEKNPTGELQAMMTDIIKLVEDAIVKMRFDLTESK